MKIMTTEISKSPRVPRSYDELLVAFFLSKFGTTREGKSAGPPLCFGTRTLKETIELFYGAFGRGREPRSFYLSMKNARDAFDGHTQTSGRVGWKSGDAAQDLTALAQEVWDDLSPLSELEMTGRVYALLQTGQSQIEQRQKEISSVAIGLTEKSGNGNNGRRRSEDSNVIGRLAEDWVKEYLEVQDGVTKIRHHSAVGETPGYDLSFQDGLGDIIRVEVKGTKNPTMIAFDLTRNEWKAAKKFRGSYRVWMVTDVPRNPKIHKLDDPYGKWEDGDIGIEPTAYEVRGFRAE